MATSDFPERRPILWSPLASACWSLVFTPAFGAYLHARNADVLGRADEARTNRLWFRVAVGYLAFVWASLYIPAIPDAVFRVGTVGLFLGWYFVAGRRQVVYVREAFSTGYHQRPLTKPLLIGLGVLLGVLVIDFGLMFIWEPLSE